MVETRVKLEEFETIRRGRVGVMTRVYIKREFTDWVASTFKPYGGEAWAPSLRAATLKDRDAAGAEGLCI